MSGRSRAFNTLRTYAEDLYDWFQCLEQNEISWENISIDELLAYRDRMLDSVSPHTKRKYSASTINQRIRTICRFYEWCKDHNTVSQLPFINAEVRVNKSVNKSSMAHIDRKPGLRTANYLTLRQTEGVPRAIPLNDLRKILHNLSNRDRLIAELAISTGMRRMEIAALTHHQIPSSFSVDTENPLVKMRIIITKGGQAGERPRNVYLPVALVDRINRHIDEERQPIINRLKKQQKKNFEKPLNQLPATLFLTKEGKAITNISISKNWKAACQKVGMDYSFHGLRHTFAIITLANLQRQTQRHPNMNPLKTLQVLLGHKNIATTEIYLSSLQVNEVAITDSVEALYDRLLDRDEDYDKKK